jgi:hypothetical protein
MSTEPLTSRSAAQDGELVQLPTVRALCLLANGLTCRVAVSCEPTATPGLVIAPALQAAEQGRAVFLDGYQLVHAASGRVVLTYLHLPPFRLPPRYLHVMAAEMGGGGIDWNQPERVLTAQPRAKDAALAAHATAQEAYLTELEE